jgi:hypothetical protein
MCGIRRGAALAQICRAMVALCFENTQLAECLQYYEIVEIVPIDNIHSSLSLLSSYGTTGSGKNYF